MSCQRENHVRITAPARVAYSTLKALRALYLDAGNSSAAPVSQTQSNEPLFNLSPSFVRPAQVPSSTFTWENSPWCLHTSPWPRCLSPHCTHSLSP
jgi:hypothetical protein